MRALCLEQEHTKSESARLQHEVDTLGRKVAALQQQVRKLVAGSASSVLSK